MARMLYLLINFFARGLFIFLSRLHLPEHQLPCIPNLHLYRGTEGASPFLPVPCCGKCGCVTLSWPNYLGDLARVPGYDPSRDQPEKCFMSRHFLGAVNGQLLPLQCVTPT